MNQLNKLDKYLVVDDQQKLAVYSVVVVVVHVEHVHVEFRHLVDYQDEYLYFLRVYGNNKKIHVVLQWNSRLFSYVE